MAKLNKDLKPDRTLSAVCGLYCPSCTLYIGTVEDPARLNGLAAATGRPLEDLLCKGCRSDNLSFFCREFCKMKPCAAAKGLSFCSECEEYPCENLRAFQAAMPHRAELWDSLAQIKNEGADSWFCAQTERFACPACGTINSAYDLTCRSCGNDPGSAFTAAHRDEVLAHHGEADQPDIRFLHRFTLAFPV